MKLPITKKRNYLFYEPALIFVTFACFAYMMIDVVQLRSPEETQILFTADLERLAFSMLIGLVAATIFFATQKAFKRLDILRVGHLIHFNIGVIWLVIAYFFADEWYLFIQSSQAIGINPSAIALAFSLVIFAMGTSFSAYFDHKLLTNQK